MIKRIDGIKRLKIKMVDLAFNYQVAHFEKCINGLDLIFKREINDSDH